MHLYRPDIAFPTSFGEDQTSLNIVAIETPESVVLEAGRSWCRPAARFIRMISARQAIQGMGYFLTGDNLQRSLSVS